jgi:hypothetical protein
MMIPNSMLTSAGLRRWAMQCAAGADDPHASGDERDRLLTMRRALLDLAEAQDWLDGKLRAEPINSISPGTSRVSQDVFG